RSPVTVESLGQFSPCHPCAAEIHVKARIAPFSLDRRADVLDRRIMPPRLIRDDTNQVQSVGLLGVDGQDLAVELLGQREPPRLMVSDGCGEEFIKGRHARPRFAERRRAYRQGFATPCMGLNSSFLTAEPSFLPRLGRSNVSTSARM